MEKDIEINFLYLFFNMFFSYIYLDGKNIFIN